MKRIAELMGAEIVGRLPEIGGGAFGAARLGHIYRQRMAIVESEQLLESLGLSEATREVLAKLAEEASTRKRPVTPAQVAAQLIEEAARRYRDAS